VKEPNKFHIYETEKITRKAKFWGGLDMLSLQRYLLLAVTGIVWRWMLK